MINQTTAELRTGLLLLTKRSLVANLLLGGLFALNGCLLSGNKVFIARMSNSGYTATLWRIEAGATDKNSTNVSIHIRGITDDDTYGLIVLSVDGNVPIEMKWVNEKKLLLSCSGCNSKDVNHETVKAADVLIAYDTNLQVK